MDEDDLRLLRLHRKTVVTQEDITEAYTFQAKQFHPDNGGDPYLWTRIQSAYDKLRAQAEEGSDADSETADDEAASDDTGDESGDDAAPWTEDLQPFDLFQALGLRPPTGDGLSRVGDRARAGFHTMAYNHYPRRAEAYATAREYAAVVLAFRRACVAFIVLCDEQRHQIYNSCGYAGLRASEAYQEDGSNVFEMDPCKVRSSFFAGRDEADRQYLLLHGPGRPDREVATAGDAELRAQEEEPEEEEEPEGDAAEAQAGETELISEDEESEDDEHCELGTIEPASDQALEQRRELSLSPPPLLPVAAAIDDVAADAADVWADIAVRLGKGHTAINGQRRSHKASSSHGARAKLELSQSLSRSLSRSLSQAAPRGCKRLKRRLQPQLWWHAAVSKRYRRASYRFRYRAL